MKKLHIINLGKMGGVERLFLQYINDTTDGSNQVLCISRLLCLRYPWRVPVSTNRCH